MVSILYLAHDLDDSAIWRRVAMLQAGGAQVTLAGFRRGNTPLPGPALVLGVTSNGRMVQRLRAVAQAVFAAGKMLGGLPRPDIILARNVEMLAIARRARPLWSGQAQPGLAYEVLDIHRMMLGDGLRAKAMRGAERALARDAGLLLTSSPGFVREYFAPYEQLSRATRIHLVENKVNDPSLGTQGPPDRTTARHVPTIGWFGILRCAASLKVLDQATRSAPGRYKVLLAGRPALDVVPDFHAIIGANPDIEFTGPYQNPDDLPNLYGAVDFAWLVDRYEAGQNSDWLLPNRLYEGCAFGAVPIALAGTEVARKVADLGVGLTLPDMAVASVCGLLEGCGQAERAALGAAVAAVPRTAWVATKSDAQDLVDALAILAKPSAPLMPVPANPVAIATGSVLIVIPTLNEAAHIAQVLDSLLPFAGRSGARIVVADGGSVDGTQAIVSDRVALGQPVTLLHNPARLQSAAINLAVDACGSDASWLIRIDAHADYPPDYCDVLLAEASSSGADSVVVGMEAVGNGLWQTAVAAAQNSRFGNGGAAHRMAPVGRFVDHGHHALIRLSAFRAVGCYDPAFSHNEDAELDVRLRAAGGRIWLTAATRLAYFPRRSPGALVRQYFRFGRGRAQNILKHKSLPGLRQMVVIALAPALGLAVLTPLSWVFAVPMTAWLVACLVAGGVIAKETGDPRSLLAGFAAGAMHAAWSAGFWVSLVAQSWQQIPEGAKA